MLSHNHTDYLSSLMEDSLLVFSSALSSLSMSSDPVSARLSCEEPDSVATHGDNMMEEIVASGGREAAKLLDIMFTASQNIGDKDRAMGLGRFMIHDPRSRISNLLLEGKMELAASLCDSNPNSRDANLT